MGCAGCGTSTGAPKGCKSNGHCMTGGCNKLNSFDWLAGLPGVAGYDQVSYHEVGFKDGSRKAFFKDEKSLGLITGDLVVVESTMGHDVGRVMLSGELVKLQMKKKKVDENSPDVRKIYRKATEEDIEGMEDARAKEHDMMVRSRAIARSLNLEMKIGDVELQADKKKATFYYTADERVDFRELIKVYAREFKVKIEMRQIGARQEAGRIGGIGSCGRELCCSTWLTSFKSVGTSAARYQNLSINLSKLSGQCGRLKCCLNYELDTYLEALEEFPKNVDTLQTRNGEARLMKTDILKRMMWYVAEGSTTFYPLTVEQVIEVQEMNKRGEKPESLVELAQIEEPEKEPDFEDVVGQISLSAIEKTDKKRKKKKRKKRKKGGGGPQQQNKGGRQQQKGGKPKGQGGGQNRKGGGGKRRSNRPNNRNKGGNKGGNQSS